MKELVPHGEFWLGDSLEYYQYWNPPMAIISDGPYGIDGYAGDAKNPGQLKSMYLPHIKKWSEKVTSETTLWFWNTEVGWANVHPILIENGWVYRSCNIWNKGIKHIAGNCNGKTMRKFPVVTEVCAHYVRKEAFLLNTGEEISVQQWLREEWKRTGLLLSEANAACGVKNAATRKYLTKDHLWYFPPYEVFQKLVNYANNRGNPNGVPYFSLDGLQSLNKNQWQRLRAKFNFEYGVTNVWDCSPVRGKERLKDGTEIFHPNQKPKELIKRIILASTDIQDIIWEPFAGTATGCKVAQENDRFFYGAEIDKNYYEMALKRLK